MFNVLFFVGYFVDTLFSFFKDTTLFTLVYLTDTPFFDKSTVRFISEYLITFSSETNILFVKVSFGGDFFSVRNTFTPTLAQVLDHFTSFKGEILSISFYLTNESSSSRNNILHTLLNLKNIRSSYQAQT